MNRFITLVALQSAVAAAVLAVAPLANAESEYLTAPAPAVITADSPSREEVRRQAIEARDLRVQQRDEGESPLDPAGRPFTSTLTRAQVRAEAVEATRLGVTGGYEDKNRPTPAQLAQIQRAGERAAVPMVTAGVR
jgi:hypothetical protein